MKKMSDSEAQEFAFKKLTGDLDKIEAGSVFDDSNEPESDPHKGVEIKAHGVTVTLKPQAGEQTKEMPAEEMDDDADKRPMKLGL